MQENTQSPEFDLDAGAQRLGTDRKQLEAMLPAFLQDHENILQRVREALAAGDYRAIQGWAHKVKGSYRIGADRLEARAEALEKRIDAEGTASTEEIETFCDEL